MNCFAFSFKLRPGLLDRIRTFLDEHILPKFLDRNFIFDIYIPPPYNRVWLIDINPWALRIDPLLFSWLHSILSTDKILVVYQASDMFIGEYEDGMSRFQRKVMPNFAPGCSYILAGVDKGEGIITESPTMSDKPLVYSSG